MDIEFWKASWQKGKIGFHEGKPNHFLSEEGGRLGTSRRVLVPLCGKTEDLAFLAAKGHEVIGIEVVEDAVKAFFSEHGLSPEVAPRGELTAYSAQGITILAGDFFRATRADVGDVNAFYDRAAFVALPAEMRPRYVAHVRSLAGAGATGLLVTFEYDQSKFDGPPFSISSAHARELWGPHIEAIGTQPETRSSRLRELGIEAHDHCYAVTL